MPYPTAQLSKRTLRAAVASHLGDNWAIETTGAGNAGGTTAVSSSLTGTPTAALENLYLLLEEGTNDGEWRPTASFAPSTGTITVRRAYTAQVATSLSAHLHRFRPDLYTTAINEAIRECYRAVYRDVLHHTFIRSSIQRTIPLPRNMERVMRLMEDARATEKLRDYFDRSNSTTDPGSKWTASVGTWGITSEGLYCVSDTDADLLLAATNPQAHDVVLEAPVRGDTTNGASRVLSLVFRYEDSSNYLLVRLLNGAADLRKVDGGTESSLTTATLTTTENVDYLVRVMCQGQWVRVWVDDVEVIHYELTGQNLKYLGYDENGTVTYGNAGVRLDKAGSPSLAATATRLSHYFLHEVVNRAERGDWRAVAGGRMLELHTMNRGWGLSASRMLWVEGMAPLSTLTADTTYETLASDSTATLELLATDPAYNFFTMWAAAVVLREASQPGNTNDPDLRKEYAQRSADLLAQAKEDRRKYRMDYPMRRYG